MSWFSSLPINSQNLICLSMFIATLSQLALCIYKWICSRQIKRLTADTALFLLLLVALSIVRASFITTNNYIPINVPWVIFLIISAGVLVYSIIGMVRENKRSKRTLSPYSIKQALDNLNSGICFCDSTGKIVLINHTMNRLASLLIGSFPQTLCEIENALKTPKNGIIKIETNPELFRFPDGRVWRYNTVKLTEKELPGFTQTTAQDVTELYEASGALKLDNERLRKTNEKLGKMYERLADRIKEQETLNLKMRIHNDIGTSLISISKIMSGNADGDTETQLKLLQSAVSYFSNNRPYYSGTFEDVKQKAKEMNINLVIDGYLPSNDSIERIVTAATGECVTNCYNHAGGDSVTVKISEKMGVYTILITNNGKIPEGEIAEGGGLSSLRKRVENAGGEMYICYNPKFALIINLTQTEDENV